MGFSMASPPKYSIEEIRTILMERLITGSWPLSFTFPCIFIWNVYIDNAFLSSPDIPEALFAAQGKKHCDWCVLPASRCGPLTKEIACEFGQWVVKKNMKEEGVER